MMATTQATKRLEEWFLAKNRQYEGIDPDLDLIENRVVDSLSFVEFVFFLGQLTQTPIDVQNIDIDDFRTLRRIGAKYLQAAGE